MKRVNSKGQVVFGQWYLANVKWSVVFGQCYRFPFASVLMNKI